MSDRCPKCSGTRWVCESHPDKAWPDACNCDCGMPCTCNPHGLLGPGVRVLFASDEHVKREREAWS